LKADGSVSTLTNSVTGTGVSGRVALWNGTNSINSDADLLFNGTELNVSGIKIDGSSIPYIISNLAGNDLNIQFPVGQGLSINNNGAENIARISKNNFLLSGASTIQTSTGNLTLSTAAGNGDIILSPNGTGKVGIGISTPEAQGLNVAGGGIIVSLDSGAARKVLELYANSTGAKVSSTYVGASSYGSLELLTSNIPRLTITAAGDSTFSGALNGTSAVFANSSILSTNMASPQLRLINNATATANQRVDLGLRWEDGTYNGIGGISMIRESATGRNGTIVIQPINSSGDPLAALTLTSTGAATFSSSVQAIDLIAQRTVGADTVGGSIILSRNNLSSYRAGAIFSYYYAANLVGHQDTLSFGVSADATSPATVGKVKMVITEGGNVGIGTTSPLNKFVASNGGAVGFEIDPTVSASVARTLIYNRATSAYANIENWALSHQFHVNGGTEAMRITSGGYLKASNNGTYSNATGTFHEFRTSLGNNNVVYFVNTASSNPYGPYINFLNAAPNDSTRYFLLCSDTGGDRFIVRSNGGLANYSANDVNLSDERVKKTLSLLNLIGINLKQSK
jgi:hypothetical protein